MTNPTIEVCGACAGTGVGCPEECHGTGRIVTGGTLPSLLSVADQLRAVVAHEMEMDPRNRVLTPEQLDELAVLAESCDRYSGRLHALSEDADHQRARAELAEAACRFNDETIRAQQQQLRDYEHALAAAKRAAERRVA